MRNTIDATRQDFSYAWRIVKRSPGFTFFATLTIALGLGANAAIFSLVDGVLLKSFSYPEPERIVQLWEKPPRGLRNGISAANHIDWTKQSQSFEAMAAQTGAAMSYAASSATGSTGGEPRSLRVAVVSAPYFEVFGTRAALGRTFARDEDQPGREKVTVISHRLWLNLFGADLTLVGRDILLNGAPYTVVGVLPGNSEFDRRSADLWIPLAFPATVARDYHYLGAVARLKRGVSFEQAQAEMRAIAEGIATRYPDVKKGWGATVDRYIDRVVGPQMQLSLRVLMAAVVAVLLIGCANLANMLMARATLRSREIALRLALGADRTRLVRMLLTESLMLSAFGGLLGVGLGYALLRGIQGLLPPFYFPAEANIGMDGRVLLFLAVVTILTSVAFGLTPALRALRRDAAEALKEGGRTSSAGRRDVYVGSGDPAMLIKSIQQAVRRVNKYQVLDRPMTVTQLKADSMIGRRLPTYLLGGFALLAMLLACAGIYGVLSFVTAKRTQELGIRAALGASQWDLVRMVIRAGTMPVIVGIVLGLGGAMWLSRFIQAMLFQVSPIDAPSLLGVAALFLTVALVACFVPAWRASRMDPMTALRQE